MSALHQMIISSSGIYLLGFSLNAVFCFFKYVVLVQKLNRKIRQKRFVYSKYIAVFAHAKHYF